MSNELMKKIIDLSNLIHKNTIRGGANWIVASPYVERELKEIQKKEEAIKRLKKRIKDVFNDNL